MCAKIKRSKNAPGTIHSLITRHGKTAGLWGFENGSRYNARIESIPLYWKDISSNRGILQVDSFWEQDKEFISKNSNPLNIGVLYNDIGEFAIITTPADDLVKLYHHRMPLILSQKEADLFLEQPEIPLLTFGKVKLAA